ERGVVIVPVVVVPDQGDGVPHLPVLELERARAVEPEIRAAVVGAGLVQERRALDPAGLTGHLLVEQVVRLGECDGHLQRAGGLDRLDVLERVRDHRADLRVEVTAEAGDDVISGHLRAVVEPDTLPELVDEGRRIRAVHTHRQRRLQLPIRSDTPQRFTDRGAYRLGGDVAGPAGGVKLVRLRGHRPRYRLHRAGRGRQGLGDLKRTVFRRIRRRVLVVGTATGGEHG